MTCRLVFVCPAIWFSIAKPVYGRGRADDEVHGNVLGEVGDVERIPLFMGAHVHVHICQPFEPPDRGLFLT